MGRYYADYAWSKIEMTNPARTAKDRGKNAPVQHLIAKWKRRAQQGDAPIFQQLARAIVSDIRSGEVVSGSKLPTHRNLAHQLGITVATASRAYSEIRRIGLIEAGAGRGTYVRGEKATRRDPKNGSADLRFHDVPTIAYANEMARTLVESAPELAEHRTLGRTDYTVSDVWAKAGAAWLDRFCGCRPDAADVVVTGGIQQALVSAFLTFTTPGTTIITEKLTYGGVKAAAAALDLDLVGVEMDDLGIVPEVLDSLCVKHRPAALVCVPTLHNPTAATMTEQRRSAVVHIARKHSLAIIEDDAYAAFDDEGLPPLYSLYPEKTILLTSLSKPISPNLRVGFATARPPILERLSAIVRATGATPQPLAAEIAARWIMDGTANSIFRANAAELADRNRHFLSAMKLGRLRSHRQGPHVWLELPTAWRVEDFMALTHQRKISVLPAGAFALECDEVLNAVRISLSAAAGRDQVIAAAAEMSDILKNPRSARFDAAF